MRINFRETSITLALACASAFIAFSCTQTQSKTPALSSPAAPKPRIAWDWTGIIGTGQSLGVGQNGRPPASTTQPYHNLKLSTANLQWPIDPNNDALKLVPLTEPIGRQGAGMWPNNINGETPHSAMANELAALVEAQFNRDFISIHSNVGENGKGIVNLQKTNPRGRAFEASLIETKAITRLAKDAGKTFGVGAITVTHGESDNGNANYDQLLHQLWQDYNTDLPAITGQKEKILMIVSQQNAYDNSQSELAIWRAGNEFPSDIVCSGPKYQYAASDSPGLHLTTDGYRLLGEKYAEVYYQRVILGNNWRPLEPTTIDHAGKTITVHFHVPNPPLAWDTAMNNPHEASAEWKNGKGFEIVDTNNKRVTIDSVAINGNAVVISCAADPGTGARLGYAYVGEGRAVRAYSTNSFGRWGLLKDSDPIKGDSTGKVQPNYALSFLMPIP